MDSNTLVTLTMHQIHLKAAKDKDGWVCILGLLWPTVARTCCGPVARYGEHTVAKHKGLCASLMLSSKLSHDKSCSVSRLSMFCDNPSALQFLEVITTSLCGHTTCNLVGGLVQGGKPCQVHQRASGHQDTLERRWDVTKNTSMSCHMDVKWWQHLEGEPKGKDGEDVAMVLFV